MTYAQDDLTFIQATSTCNFHHIIIFIDVKIDSRADRLPLLYMRKLIENLWVAVNHRNGVTNHLKNIHLTHSQMK